MIKPLKFFLVIMPATILYALGTMVIYLDYLRSIKQYRKAVELSLRNYAYEARKVMERHEKREKP